MQILSKLIAELKQAISGGKLLANSAAAVTESGKVGEQEIPTAFANVPLNLGSPEGTMPHEFKFLYRARNRRGSDKCTS